VAAVTANLLTEKKIDTLWWASTDATTAGAATSAVFTFGKDVGQFVYLAKLSKTSAAPVNSAQYGTPRYDSNKTIPQNAAQSIPLDSSPGADPTLMFFAIDDTQNFQILVTGLDVTSSYTLAIATDYQFGRC
jgi:hypothetical protein